MRGGRGRKTLAVFVWFVAFAGVATAGVPANVAKVVASRCAGCRGG
ncbi:MAG: hypothetical protein ACKO6B_10675 [Planctomycetia bacterium]